MTDTTRPQETNDNATASDPHGTGHEQCLRASGESGAALWPKDTAAATGLASCDPIGELDAGHFRTAVASSSARSAPALSSR